MTRKSVFQLIQELDLPVGVFSLEEAGRWAPALTQANASFNWLYAQSSAPVGPGDIPEPFEKGEAFAWEEGLRHLHGLQSQALVWRVAELFEGFAELEGFFYQQFDCRKSPQRHRTSVSLLKFGEEWLEPRGEAHVALAKKIEDHLNELPDMIVFNGRETRWSRPDGGAISIAWALMEADRAKIGPKCFSSWEAHQMGHALELKSSKPGLRL